MKMTFMMVKKRDGEENEVVYGAQRVQLLFNDRVRVWNGFLWGVLYPVPNKYNRTTQIK